MIILASGSPRRRELLSDLGAEIKIITADVDESSEETNPEALAEALAKKKGLAVYEKLLAESPSLASLPIVSADTVVFCDGEIMGKPHDRADAYRMLEKLSGKAHTVTTGICVISGGTPFSSFSTTKVFVDPLTEDEINAYIDSGDPFDKAGSYGIQGIFSKHISKIEGCYFNVVGLPLNALSKLFKEATGVSLG
ncbi:MAG: septum formation protein Maf [Clostridia bacterium]|nr:septum formation protein Maf [Clostridia bacterium]